MAQLHMAIHKLYSFQIRIDFKNIWKHRLCKLCTNVFILLM